MQKNYPRNGTSRVDTQARGAVDFQVPELPSSKGELTRWQQVSPTKPSQFSSQGFQGPFQPSWLDQSQAIDGSPSGRRAARLLLAALRLFRNGAKFNPAWQIALELLIRILDQYQHDWDNKSKGWDQQPDIDMSGWTKQCGVAQGQLFGYSISCIKDAVQFTSSLSRTEYFAGGNWHRNFIQNIRNVAGGFSYFDVNGYFTKPGVSTDPPNLYLPEIYWPAAPEPPPWAVYGPDYTKPGDGPIGAAPPVKDWKHRGGRDSGYGESSSSSSSSATGTGGAGKGPYVSYFPGPPAPGVKERKVKVATSGPLRVFLDQIGESKDFVEALWDALPKELKEHKTINRPWPYKSEKPKMQEMLSDLYKAWPKMDLAYFYKAIDKVMLNQIEDWFYGRLGQAGGKAGAAIGRPTGVGTGWAL